MVLRDQVFWAPFDLVKLLARAPSNLFWLCSPSSSPLVLGAQALRLFILLSSFVMTVCQRKVKDWFPLQSTDLRRSRDQGRRVERLGWRRVITDGFGWYIKGLRRGIHHHRQRKGYHHPSIFCLCIKSQPNIKKIKNWIYWDQQNKQRECHRAFRCMPPRDDGLEKNGSFLSRLFLC